jgi:hypothetical protein
LGPNEWFNFVAGRMSYDCAIILQANVQPEQNQRADRFLVSVNYADIGKYFQPASCT